MMEFLAFIGVIAILVAGKFIYDTYLIKNTETNWAKYQRHNIEQFGRAENNKVASYVFLANNLHCAPEDVENIYLADLRKKISSSPEALELAKSWKNEKYVQSKQLNIDPDDTPASLLEAWTMSLFNDLQYSESMFNKDIDNEIEEQDDDEYEEYENEEDEVDEEEEDDEYYQNEYEDEKMSGSGLRGIEIKKSQWDDVVEAFGLPDKVQDHNGFSLEMIYNNVGLSFYVKGRNKTVVVIEIHKKFKKYFPKLDETDDNNITIGDILNSYGQGKTSTRSNSLNGSYIEILYPNAIEFSSCYFKNYIYDKELLKLRIVKIGSF